MDRKQRLITILAALAIPLSLAVLFLTHETSVEEAFPVIEPIPEVSIVTTSPAKLRGHIEAFGEAKARFDITLSANIAGRIEETLPAAESGARVNIGQTLMRIEDSDFQLALATARRALADARVMLLQEQHRAEQAKREWTASGLDSEPLSDLVLRKPQLNAANAALEEARANLAAAKKNLGYTRVSAPFDGVVVERLVGPGKFVPAGTELVRLLSSDRVEIRIPLTDRQWQTVSTNPDNIVELTARDNHQRWRGYVLRAEKHITRANRQRALIVAVDKPLDQPTPLYAGTFVTARIPTREIDNAVALPATALTPGGEIWFVDKENRLATLTPVRTYTLAEQVAVQLPVQHTALRALVRPLRNYSIGQTVIPRREDQP